MVKPDEDEEGRASQGNLTPIVFAISCGGGGPHESTFGAVLNRRGECIDHIQLHYLHGRDRERRPEDFTKLATFLKQYPKIDTVVVGGWSMSVRQILTDIPSILMTAEVKQNIVLIKDEVARLFRNSKRAEKEFPTFHPTLRYCISLGRSAQEPLFEYGALFGTEKEVLFLQLHPLQKMIPQERLYRSLERIIVDIVNENGFDMNRALRNPIAENNVQFVCGLGPRKGFALLQHLRTAIGALVSRNDLVIEAGLGPYVYRNCASFIRVTPSARDDEPDPLDDTRIHPEDYKLARQMAADALEVEDVADGDLNNPSEHVNQLREDVSKLDELDLHDFAKQLEQSTGEPKFLTLQLIATELKFPYKDFRFPFQTATAEEVFTMLTGETDQTLRVGTTLAVVVHRVKDRLVIVNLESGIEGLISSGNLMTGQECKEGDVLQCRVVKVYKEKFAVDLTCRMMDVREQGGRRRDPYFDLDAERGDSPDDPNQRRRRRTIVQRSIKHPLFQNINSREAERFLSTRPMGECVFRPSSQGADRFVVSWKVADGVFQHVEVKEFMKDNEYSLGKDLVIDKTHFSDLDEIAALFVDKMAARVRQIQAYSKYRDEEKDELYEYLERAMKANPKQIPYVVGMLKDQPGKFCLAYKLRANMPARHEVSPVRILHEISFAP